MYLQTARRCALPPGILSNMGGKMTPDAIKTFFALFGLYAGVMAWLFKTAWADIQTLKKEVGAIRENCVKCQSSTIEAIHAQIDERFDKIEQLIDHKIDAYMTKVELNWINNGQIPPKSSRKKKEGEQ